MSVSVPNSYFDQDSECEWCGTKTYLEGGEVHHLYRRSTHKHLIDNLDNLVVLCRDCHFKATNDRNFEEKLQRRLYGDRKSKRLFN